MLDPMHFQAIKETTQEGYTSAQPAKAPPEEFSVQELQPSFLSN
jgi:hypothetical protein